MAADNQNSANLLEGAIYLIGQTISHFKILDKLGEGGMGEVYLAEDTKLGREVAIKVLPEDVATDAERLARFEREAKVLAALNHPNIAAIYSLESAPSIEAAGRPSDESKINFLVMELAQGEDLIELMKRGPVPVEDTIAIALQVSEALEAAHEQGIIHRDLKPANIKVDGEGKVKVLDFGLAKALDTSVGLGSSTNTSLPTQALSMSPTLTAQMTQAGIILGTAAYMSPEQARGKPVDARADLWAFGVVLFEMLSGQRLFANETVTDVLAAVVKTEPDWSLLPANSPGPLRRLLARCLNKDRNLRQHHAGDARLELLSAQAEDESPSQSPPDSKSRLRALPWILTGIAAVIAVYSISVGGTGEPTNSAPLIRLEVELPLAAHPIEPRIGGAVSLSPRGDLLILAVTGSDDTPLYRRTLDDTTPHPIPGTEGATVPFFSPDGRSLAFFRAGEIVKILLPGGVPTTVVSFGDYTSARTFGNRGACWTDDGFIVFAASQESPLYRVADDGGTPEPITTLEGIERSHRWPTLLPDGKTVLFTVEEADDLSFDEARIEALDLETGVRTVVADGGSLPKYSPTGHLLYLRGGDVYARRFNAETLTMEGAPVIAYESVLHHSPSGTAAFDLSRSGSFAAVPEYREVELDLVQRDPDGSIRLLWSPDQKIDSLRTSPDGRFVAILLDREIWLYDLERNLPTRLTTDSNTWGGLTWSPDGERIAFSAQPRGVSLPNMFWISTLSEAAPRLVFEDDEGREPGSWTADDQIVFEHLGNIFRVEPTSPESVIQVTDTQSEEFEPVVSPNGKWLAYTSNESGTFEVYLRLLQRGARRYRVSTDGGFRATWSYDGTTIYYQQQDSILAVSADLDSAVKIGSPEPVISGGIPEFGRSRYWRSYDSLPESGGLIMLKARNEPPRPNPILSLNWSQELERLVP